MHPRHKSKAIIGIILWLVVPFMLALVCGLMASVFAPSGSSNLRALSIGIFIAAQYTTFFWGGSHLAKAKGYSNAILLWGVLCPLGQLVVLAVLLFAMPDRCPVHRDHSHK